MENRKEPWRSTDGNWGERLPDARLARSFVANMPDFNPYRPVPTLEAPKENKNQTPCKVSTKVFAM